MDYEKIKTQIKAEINKAKVLHGLTDEDIAIAMQVSKNHTRKILNDLSIFDLEKFSRVARMCKFEETFATKIVCELMGIKGEIRICTKL